MGTNNPTKPTVFISYTHKDEAWKDRLRPHLKMLEQAGLDIVVWDDRAIDGGAKWYNEIKQAMDSAVVAVCLISADYLASDFCIKEEIPYLLKRRENNGMVLLPILVRPCLWSAFHWLRETQMLPRDGTSIAECFKGSEDRAFLGVATIIYDLLYEPNDHEVDPAELAAVVDVDQRDADVDQRAIDEVPLLLVHEPHIPLWQWPDKIDISRLPVTGAELFGRHKELEMLDAAWAADSTNIAVLVAWGGVGKSTLVNKWLERLQADNYRGARRVYAWSFYSQGTGERVTSADLFINDALKWFGDSDPAAGSPWAKGERLAHLVQSEKTLLLLDGLEPMQSPHAHEHGKIRDPALLTLLTELASHNAGLCLITTREPVIDLEEFAPAAQHKDLEQISDEAGRALLRVGGVQGTDAELEESTRAFGNHALAINLLAVYLRDVPGHRVSHAATIPDLDILQEAGKHARRLVAAFAQRFGDSAEVELLQVLGLFDRPADSKSLEALRAKASIPGLTDHLHSLSEADWLRLIKKLRHTKLIAPAGRHGSTDLDAHPLVREHFGRELEQYHAAAWREGNNRLYEHLRDTTKEFPDTLEEMAPLYTAMEHGCKAGRHREVLHKVYWARIQRGEQNFSWRQLGVVSANLAALSNFFSVLWNQPIAGLSENGRNFVLSDAGFYFMVLGRFREAIQPFRVVLDEYVALGNFAGASVAAGNLCEIYSALGDLDQALFYAQKSEDMATNSGDMFYRATSRAYTATVLYLLGHLPEAETAFLEAEKMQSEDEPRMPYLYSISGFWYCALLMDKGRYQEIKDRLVGPLGAPDSLLDVALKYLSLGQAHLLQVQMKGTGKLTEAAEYLTEAMKYLRQNVSQGYLGRGVLARVELYRVTLEFDRARAHLDEAMRIATRGGMALHQADCHLEYARLYLAMSDEAAIKQVNREKAQGHWATAREMIERMGYHRRDSDVQEIEAQLAQAS